MEIRNNVPVKEFTSFQIGGRVKYFAEVSDSDSLILAVKKAKELKTPLIILGGGNNVAFHDGDLDLFVVMVKGGKMKVEGNHIICDAGVLLDDLAQKSVAVGLAGLEKLSAIPGTVGGSVYGNAGAYGQTISTVVESVFIFDGKKIKEIPKKECGFDYRGSIFKKKKWIILGARFVFKKGKKEELVKQAGDIKNIRMAKFPRGLRCAGSFFKNVPVSKIPKKVMPLIDQSKIMDKQVPVGHLLEMAGVKGMREGGAYVADFHSNFLMNDGSATYADLRRLADKMKAMVLAKFGVKLEEEVRMLGSAKTTSAETPFRLPARRH